MQGLDGTLPGVRAGRNNSHFIDRKVKLKNMCPGSDSTLSFHRQGKQNSKNVRGVFCWVEAVFPGHRCLFLVIVLVLLSEFFIFTVSEIRQIYVFVPSIYEFTGFLSHGLI